MRGPVQCRATESTRTVNQCSPTCGAGWITPPRPVYAISGWSRSEAFQQAPGQEPIQAGADGQQSVEE